MNLNIWVSILVLLAKLHAGYGQVLSCSYIIDSNFGYTCYLTIQNPNGLNNFTGINGTHLTGKSNDDVRYIKSVPGSNTANIPSIICETFRYATRIFLQQIEIQTVDEYSFNNCKNILYLDLIDNKITKVDEKSFNENLELQTLYLYYNQLTTLPENVFVNQQKLVTLWLDSNNITDLPENIFHSLTNLNRLDLQYNQIKNLRIEWFENLQNLNILFLYSNQIEELPKNVFSPMKNLTYLDLYSNNLEIIHSDSFGILSNLTQVFFDNNKINAIDERFIDNTGVIWFYMYGNVCASVNIFDNSTSRQTMRNGLQTCFDNYEALYPETTTTTISTTTSETTTTSQTLPPGCSDGNLDERVCRLENQNEELRENIEFILKEKEEMRENFESQIEALVKENEEQRSSVGAALEDLQNQILILSTRPCSCH